MFKSGSIYVGNFKKDRPHGKGTFFNAVTGETYIGDWFQGLKHGYGVMTSHARSDFHYSGYWMNGEPHGYGLLKEGGTSYEGKFNSGKRHGTGRETLADGTEYIGHYRNNTFDGMGCEVFPSGGRFEGQFKRNTRHGLGKMIWPDGASWQGVWTEGVAHGQGTLEERKLRQKGVWIRNLRLDSNYADRLFSAKKKVSEDSPHRFSRRPVMDTLMNSMSKKETTDRMSEVTVNYEHLGI